MIHSTFLAAAVFLVSVSAQTLPTFSHNNDWSKPCFNGECYYDHPVSSTGRNVGSTGSMKIWGRPEAISDITEAAGWVILDCDSNRMEQDIRLACMSSIQDEVGCSNLFQSIPPTGKIVRLPESCGRMPFARVAKHWIPEDQSIPAKFHRRLVRRQDELAPKVQALALDTNFAAVDPATSGPVNLAVQGSNVPGSEGNATQFPPQRRSRIMPRALFVEDSLSNFNSFNESVKKDLPPINIDESLAIASGGISCPAVGVASGFDVTVDTKVNAQVVIGVAASGTIIPPSIDSFAIYSNLNADFDGALNFKAFASGTISTGELTLFQLGIPGLDFPGILTIGPSFKINAEAKATLSLDVDLSVNLAYSIKDATLFFPKSQNRDSKANPKPSDSNLKLSVTPSVAAEGTIEAHLIPTIDFGISALAGIAEATVFLAVDASAAVELSLEASAPIPVSGQQLPQGQVTGCVDIVGGISIDAGANAQFFGIFDPNVEVNLFNREFDLFQTCVGTRSRAARRFVPNSSQLGMSKRQNLPCGVNLELFADEAVKGSNILAL